VERKRMHGLEPGARSGAGLGEGIYSAQKSAQTYARLAHLARGLLTAGYRVVVDAAFLEHGQRRRFGELAKNAGAAFCVVSCSAAPGELRQRLALRSRGPREASEAGIAVLERQLAAQQPLRPDEAAECIVIDTAQWASQAAGVCRELERRLQRAA
jgi:predicted kinase